MSFYSLITLLSAFLLADDLSNELKFVSRLRDRGLYRLSAAQCKELLQDSQLSKDAELRIGIELSKTFAAHALNSRPPAREQYWEQSVAVLEQASQRELTQGSQILLQTQRALTVLQQAEWTRRESEIQASQEADWQPARAQIRKAIQQLKAIQTTLQSPRVRAGSTDLSATRADELLRNTQFQLARAYRNQALTYTARRDRVNSLTQAIELLQPIATSTVMDDLGWRSRLDWIQCHRRLGELQKTQQLITGASQVPKRYLGQLAAEGIRLALDAKQPTAAAKMLQNPSLQDSSNPEFALATIETWVALAAAESQPIKREPYQRKAVELATDLGPTYGTYWGLRGEMLIASLAEGAGGTADSNLIDRTANTLLRRNQSGRAAEMFERGAAQAESAGDRTAAFDFLYKAATVEHERKSLASAIQKLSDAAVRYPEHEQASEAHLLAAFDAAALYQQYMRTSQTASAQDSLTTYRELLAEHLRRWPDRPSADQARLWAGRMAEATGDVAQAIQLYQTIKSGSDHAAEAYNRLGTLFGTRLKPSSPTFSEHLHQTRGWFEQRLLVGRDTEDLITAATQSARLHTLFPPIDYKTASKHVRRALSATEAKSANAPDSITQAEQTLRALLVVIAAGSNDLRTAHQQLTLASPLPNAALIEMLTGLQVIRDLKIGELQTSELKTNDSHAGDPETGRVQPDSVALDALMRDVVNMLKTNESQWSAAARLLVEQVLADTMEVQLARRAYASLAKRQPHQSRIQLRYAELLSQGKDRESRELAIAQWRSIAKQSRPKSPAWFRAKLGVAQSQFDKGDHQKAKEIVELLTTLYPQLGGPHLKRQFQQLLIRCQD